MLRSPSQRLWERCVGLLYGIKTASLSQSVLLNRHQYLCSQYFRVFRRCIFYSGCHNRARREEDQNCHFGIFSWAVEHVCCVGTEEAELHHPGAGMRRRLFLGCPGEGKEWKGPGVSFISTRRYIKVSAAEGEKHFHGYRSSKVRHMKWVLCADWLADNYTYSFKMMCSQDFLSSAPFRRCFEALSVISAAGLITSFILRLEQVCSSRWKILLCVSQAS